LDEISLKKLKLQFLVKQFGFCKNFKNKIKQKTEIYFSKILFIKLFYFLKYLIDLHMFRLWLRQNLFKISTKGYKNYFKNNKKKIFLKNCH
jgi:hypothetical protein